MDLTRFAWMHLARHLGGLGRAMAPVMRAGRAS